MNKKLFITLLVVIHLLLIWSVLFAVDYGAVMNLGNPIVARHVGAEGGTFRGPGWTVEIEKHHDKKYGWVTDSVEMYLFGKLIGAAIT